MGSDYKNHLFALIVVGGGGTRLWPRSRNKTPKQFLKIFNKQSLTQITAKRFNKFIPWENIFAVTTTEDYKNEILKEVPELPPQNVIFEPLRRNTAPAHGLGADYILKKDPQAVIINDYSDHLINPEKLYMETMKSAAMAAFSGDYLIATGIKPAYPNIGYGHVKKGEKFGDFEGKTVYKLDKFVEKPPLELAKEYTASGEYFWNAGQYIWRADSYLKALAIFQPKVGEALKEIYDSIGTSNEIEAIKNGYAKMPELTAEGKPMSVDYAVSEKAKNILLAIGEYGWTDIGDWKEVWDNLPKDNENNVIIDGLETGGEVMNFETKNALIQTDGRLIATIGLNNIVIVDTKDALLVCAKDKAQEVKKIVEKIKEEKKENLL